MAFADEEDNTWSVFLDPNFVKLITQAHHLTIKSKSLTIRPWFASVLESYEKKKKAHTR